ncbi:MAG: N-glycosylase/DNA lyase [Candidatus Pacearchaeota archaeon]
MKEVIAIVEKHKNSPVKETIDSKMVEFEDLGKKNSNEIFKELCFCFMTANFSAHGGIKIQNEIGDGFLHLSEKELAKKLAELGHRFPNARAKYIVEAQPLKDTIKETLQEFKDEIKMREWIVKNIKGIGMKEASHFLRNIGYKNLAIIDFHILDLLVNQNLIERPKTLTTKKYMEVENILRKTSEKTRIPLGELDLYLWYEETGKVLK